MAFVSAVKPANSFLQILAAPFIAFWNVLIAIGEAHPTMVAVEKLNKMSDAELAERGTTRETEVRRIFSVRMAL